MTIGGRAAHRAASAGLAAEWGHNDPVADTFRVRQTALLGNSDELWLGINAVVEEIHRLVPDSGNYELSLSDDENRSYKRETPLELRDLYNPDSLDSSSVNGWVFRAATSQKDSWFYIFGWFHPRYDAYSVQVSVSGSDRMSVEAEARAFREAARRRGLTFEAEPTSLSSNEDKPSPRTAVAPTDSGRGTEKPSAASPEESTRRARRYGVWLGDHLFGAILTLVVSVIAGLAVVWIAVQLGLQGG